MGVSRGDVAGPRILPVRRRCPPTRKTRRRIVTVCRGTDLRPPRAPSPAGGSAQRRCGSSAGFVPNTISVNHLTSSSVYALCMDSLDKPVVRTLDQAIGQRAGADARLAIVDDDLVRDHGVVLRLHEEHVAGERPACRAAPCSPRAHRLQPVFLEVLLAAQLQLRQAPFRILVQRGHPQREPLDRTQRRQQRREVAAVAAPDDGDRVRIHVRAARRGSRRRPGCRAGCPRARPSRTASASAHGRAGRR